MGVPSKKWKISMINKNYSWCPSYPSRLVVPARFPDVRRSPQTKPLMRTTAHGPDYLHMLNSGIAAGGDQVPLTQSHSGADVDRPEERGGHRAMQPAADGHAAGSLQ